MFVIGHGRHRIVRVGVTDHGVAWHVRCRMLVGAGVPLPPLGDHELLVFWCQLVVLLSAARAGGYAARCVGQPRVVGELLAGVVLGPSVFGALWSDGWAWLFPPDERQAGLLLGLAWFGIVLLLMTTGAELDLATVRDAGRPTMTTAVGSLVVPLATGLVVGAWLPDRFLGDDDRRWVFALFVGVALAISSLPVAARILGDLGLLRRPVGQLVLTVATLNDIVGWLLLGVVVSLVEGGTVSVTDLTVAVVGMVVIGAAVIGYGARLLDSAVGAVERLDGGPAATTSLIVLFTVAVGAATHAIGVEVVIGAFFAGIALRRSTLGGGPVLGHIEVMSNAVFAPLFFAVASLRVDLRALDSRSVAVGTVVIVVAATAVKLAGAFGRARIGGLSNRDSFVAAASLNARGALEVVVATVGLSVGVLSQASYAAIVVMALVTTGVAAPLISLARRRGPDQ